MKEYLDSQCVPNMRVPSIEIKCTAWEHCMRRDPRQIGRTRVSAETFSEIINSLNLFFIKQW